MVFLLLIVDKMGDDVLEFDLILCADLSDSAVVEAAAAAVDALMLLLLLREMPFSWRSVGVSGLLELLFKDGGV